MEKVAADESADLYQLLAWLHTNRKRLTIILAIILVVAGAFGLYIWHQNSVEEQANAALSSIKPLTPQENAMPSPADAQPYLTVATEHQGTKAGARALLLGAGILFDAGKFDDAKTQFDKFLMDYPENPLAIEASVGVASSLEAAGKVPDATARFEEILRRHPNEHVVFQVKSALGRLYVAQNKPEQALRMYEELAKGGNNDTWSAEAGIQAEELLAKYPALRKPVNPVAVPPMAPKASATVTIPTANSAGNQVKKP